VVNRYHNGEVLHGDTSNVHAGPVFHTPAGRIVYGGGGITPDIFVALDTLQFSASLNDLYLRGTLNNFVYAYFISHRAELKKFQTPAAFYSGFNPDANIWNEFTNFAIKDSVDLKPVSAGDRSFLIIRVKALLARMIWRSQGYYYVVNQTDPVLKKATGLLESGNPAPVSAKTR